MRSNLYDKLIEYGKSDFYGFHMPGHKRNVDFAHMVNPYEIDITEIDGFDNMHVPTGIINDEMAKASDFYGSDRTYFLINGSSCGNLAAISSLADEGDKIIICRNAHKSVYNAVELRKLKVEYLYPELKSENGFLGEVRPDEVSLVIEKNLDAKAIVITSPTYEGIVSDIEKICEIAHARGIAVIVDAAHGAHFSMSNEFPKAAIKCGADIVIESLHKTLPSFTQTAVLHVKSNIVDKKRLEKYLAVFQSSSPSYVFMSSICNCIDFMINRGNAEALKWIDRINVFKDKVRNLKHFYVYDGKNDYDFDVSKLVIILKNTGLTGKWLKEELSREYHLEMEMSAGNYVIAMTSPLDTDDGMNRLAYALIRLDERIEEGAFNQDENDLVSVGMINGLSDNNLYGIRNDKVCEIYEAEKYDGSKKDLISRNYVFMNPPGIPLIVPGEIPDDKLTELIEKYKFKGYDIIQM